MVRLDRWLVDKGYFPSRQVAKRAIASGHVRLNGLIPKPASKVRPTDTVQVSEHYLVRPMGYHKLHEIDSYLGGNLIPQGSRVLDIGSSSGGFLLYALDKGAIVKGVEVSLEFAERLRRQIEAVHTASLVIADAFTVNPTDLAAPNSLDVLLIDVTTDWQGSVFLLKRFLPLLKREGRFVLAVKIAPSDENMFQLIHQIEGLGVTAQSIVLTTERQEVHLVGSKL